MPRKKARLSERLDNADLIKTSFWVSQLFMLLATILGVFLASKAGLNQALQFDNIDDMQNNYYLRRSLRDEVTDNVAAMREYIKFLKEHQQTPYDMSIYHPKTSRYVWETMKYSEFTLQTPPQFISAVRRFYATTDDLIDKGEHRVYGRHYLLPRLSKATDEIEATTLEMDQDIESLKLQLKELGSPVD